MPFPAVELLRCPVCRNGWDGSKSSERTLVCASEHRFDAARQGYVNFLTGRGTRFLPDSAEMVAARERFLATGSYAPIARALADACAAAAAGDDDGGSGPRAILDVGAGTGYYLDALLERMPGSRAVALDISKFALRRAAKLPRTAAVVWDVWRDLPLADASLDLVVDVFAPRNFPEFARALRSGGAVCIVTPSPEHLAALRGLLPMLDVPTGKAEAVATSAGPEFEAASVRLVRFPLVLTREAAADLAVMGPAGHHSSRETILSLLGEDQVQTEGVVEITVLRRR
ncbi:MAG TPA: methyltransferase domain-containing protein [Sinomonas sp.]|nr:methyltransferase domain-containing protein [Sinomonas sp.]